MNNVKIIAEAGVNHNGDPALAHELIDSAVTSGADVIKFQTFRSTDVMTAQAPKAAYQKKRTGGNDSQLDMVRKLELSEDVFISLNRHCKQKGIEFLSTPFDMPSIAFLQSLDMTHWKIPSGEITNLPYLRTIGALNRNLYLSTGMATLGEVEEALNILEHFGTPLNKIIVMHCTTEYPAPMEEVNLRAMNTMRCAFPSISGVGYSDHTIGIEVAIAAVSMGACVIEKHFTLDSSMEGPDHKASIEPCDFKQLVTAVRNIEMALGGGVKRPTKTELANRAVARKSLVASREIQEGELFAEDNITAKRPGTGISPMLWDQFIGKPARKNFKVDELLYL